LINYVKSQALGAFYDSINNTGKLLKRNFQYDLDAFDNATYEICSMSYSKLKDLKKANKADISNKKLKKLCLENVYILKLLKLFGFKSLRNVEATETVNFISINPIF
jgi:hypothetical protein